MHFNHHIIFIDFKHFLRHFSEQGKLPTYKAMSRRLY